MAAKNSSSFEDEEVTHENEHDAHIENRRLRRQVKSLNKEIEKLNQQLSEALAGIDPNSDKCESCPHKRVSGKKKRQARQDKQDNPDQSKHQCSFCNSRDTRTMDLPTRDGVKTYVICNECNGRKKL